MKDLRYHLLLEAPDRASKTCRPRNADEAARLIGDWLGGEYASPGGTDATRRAVAMFAAARGAALSFASPDGDVARLTLATRDSGGDSHKNKRRHVIVTWRLRFKAWVSKLSQNHKRWR